MTVYGFKTKDKAQRVSALESQQPPSQWTRDAVPIQFMDWLIFTPSGGIPARSGNTPGQAVCDVFYIDEQTKKISQMESDAGGGNLTITVFNVSDIAAPPSVFLVPWQVGGSAVITTSSIRTIKETIFCGPITQQCVDERIVWSQSSKEITVIDDCPADNPDCNPCSPGNSQEIFSLGTEFYECTNLCWYICTYCDEFAYDPDICDPCRGLCIWEFQSGGVQDWVLVDNQCTPQSTDCDCYRPPQSWFDSENPSPVLGDRLEYPCGSPPTCSGNCVWTWRLGTYNSASGTVQYGFWEVDNQCSPVDNDCTCCVPPDIETPTVDQAYPVPCGPLPTQCSATACRYVWDTALPEGQPGWGGDWALLPGWDLCCGDCVCAGPPDTPGTSHGELSDLIPCVEPGCTGRLRIRLSRQRQRNLLRRDVQL